MRAQEEIVKRINERQADDFFGFEVGEYYAFLTYENAKQFLKDSVTKEQFEETTYKGQTPKEVMIDYMPFAWDKANNCRGLSAGRSIQHYVAWLWLDGNDELAESIEDYEFYGKPQLVQICEYLGIDPAQWDDGIRVNSESELE